MDFRLGGLMLTWRTPADVPARVSIRKGGVQVDDLAVARIPADAIPVANLVDPAELVARIARAAPASGPHRGARLGTARILDAGPSVPYCFRPDDGGTEALTWDLTELLGLAAWLPTPASAYSFILDVAQLRCGVGLVLEWLRDDGSVTRRDEAWRDPSVPAAGVQLGSYQSLAVLGFCPDDGTALRIALSQGAATAPPDALVFFREPRLHHGEPGPRASAYVAGASLPADPGRFGLVAVGDALRLFGAPLTVSDGRVELPVPVRHEPGPPFGFGLATTVDGRELVVEGGVPAGATPVRRPVAVFVDGELAATGVFDRQGAAYGGRITLPERLFDGERRQVDVRDEMRGETLATGRIPLPALRTPPSLIRSAVSRIDAPGVLPFAEERYRGLTSTLDRLGRSDAPSWLYAEVAACHAVAMRGPDGNDASFPPRRMPTHDRPRFSIIIPVHGKFRFTYFCLASVLLTTAGLPVEVIVVDDGSDDRTVGLDRYWDGVRVIRREVAGGFLQACTAGAAEARGEFLVFLNNDTEPVGRWLEELRLPFDAFHDVGLTGARLVYPDGRLQEAGGLIWNNGRPWNFGWGGNRADPRYNYTRQADYLTGAAFMISRDAWERAGGFSPEFEPAYYEDTDLAFKVRELGLRTVYAAKSLVIHYEGVSAGTDPREGVKRFQEINRPKFEAKWRYRFRTHATEGVEPNREKDRGIVARALVLDDQPPRFDMDAGSLAISQEIRLLQSFGYKVSFAPKNMAHLGLYTETFERGGVEALHAPFYASLPDVIARRAAEFDLVYIHRFQTATNLPKLIRHHAPNARILLNCADVHFLRQLREARLLNSRNAYDAALATRDAEIAVFGEVDTVLTYSEVERAVIESQLGLDAHVMVLPFVAGDAGDPPPLDERDGIGFIGSYGHPPNRDAVEWFVRECWPRLRDRVPGHRLRIAGSGFDGFELAREDDRIEVVGWVPDARAFTGSCRVMVAPLRAGAGVKGKVVDALATGTPNVLSEIAAEGLGLEEGVSAVIARTPDAWVDGICRLINDDDAWAAMSAASLAHIRTRHSFEAGRVRFRELLERNALPYDPDPAPGEGALWPRMSYDLLSRMLG